MHKIRNSLLVFLVGLFAVSYLVVTPPFQVPDEHSHFYRSYQISEGMFFSRVIGTIKNLRGQHTGGDLPSALTQLNNRFLRVSFKPDQKLSRTNFEDAWEIRIDPHDRLPYSFNNTALFSFVSYLAPASGIQFASFFSDRALVQFYSARVFSIIMALLCFWLACVIYSPGKLIFFFVTVIPMNLQQLIAISSDSFTNSVVMLFIAMVLRIFSSQPATKLLQTVCVGFALLLASAKQIATPTLGMMIFARPSNFRSPKNYFLYMACFYLLTILMILYWATKAREVYNPLYWHPNSHAEAQIQFILANFSDVILTLKTILMDNALHYLRAGIGSELGYLDTFPPPWVITLFIVFAVLLIALHPRLEKINILQALGLLAICILGLFVVQLALYINTSPIGSNTNNHVHGRYYIPFFALALFSFIQLFPKSSRLNNYLYPYLAGTTIIAMIIASCVILWSMLLRYYY